MPRKCLLHNSVGGHRDGVVATPETETETRSRGFRWSPLFYVAYSDPERERRAGYLHAIGREKSAEGIRQAEIAEAEAAPILERGKAQVEVLKRLYAEVQTGGEAAFAVFMAEKLPELLEIAVGAVEGVDIDRVVVMDGGQGEGVSNALNQRVRGAYETMEGLASGLGLDIQEVLQRAVGSGDADGGEATAELPPRV